jgi:hypothetical protein
VIVVRDIEQGTPEWLALRAGVLTASTFKDMMAKGRGGAPSKMREALIYQLATERITGQSAEDGYSNYWMERGKAMESRARSMYEIQTGNEVECVTFVFADESKRIGCSPDGLIVGQPGGFEVKCPKLSTHVGHLLVGGLPPEHKPQVQGSLMVSGYEWWDFGSFCPDSNVELFRVRVHRDEKYIEQLRTAALNLLAEVDDVEARLREIGGQEPSEGTATAQLLMRESIA